MHNGRKRATIKLCEGCREVRSRTPHAHAYNEDGVIIDTYFSRQAAKAGLSDLILDKIIGFQKMKVVVEDINSWPLPDISGAADSLYSLVMEQMPTFEHLMLLLNHSTADPVVCTIENNPPPGIIRVQTKRLHLVIKLEG